MKCHWGYKLLGLSGFTFAIWISTQFPYEDLKIISVGMGVAFCWAIVAVGKL